MKSKTWTKIGASLLVISSVIALLVAVSRLAPLFMRGMMRSMMKQMMEGGCECDPPEM